MVDLETIFSSFIFPSSFCFAFFIVAATNAYACPTLVLSPTQHKHGFFTQKSNRISRKLKSNPNQAVAAEEDISDVARYDKQNEEVQKRID